MQGDVFRSIGFSNLIEKVANEYEEEIKDTEKNMNIKQS